MSSNEVVLRSGDFHETLDLLGAHSELKVLVGNRLVAKGVKINEWNHVRKLSTSFLTYVEIDPPANSTLPEVKVDLESPSKKACLAMGSNLLTFNGSDVEQHLNRIALDVAEQRVTQSEKHEFKTVGKLVKFDTEFFDAGYPFMERRRSLQ